MRVEELDLAADALIGVVKGATAVLEARLADALARIAALEARPMPKDGASIEGPRGPQGEAGTSVTIDDVAPLVQAEVARAVSAIPPAAPGKDADPALIAALVQAEVTHAVAALPVPKDGTHGKDADPAVVAALVEETVAKHVARLPAPKDGAGMVGGFIDRDGQLVLTFTDGTTKTLGIVVGRDGKDADLTPLRDALAEVKAWPKPKDGRDGKDGVTLTAADFQSYEYDGERGLTLFFGAGEAKATITLYLPIPIYRGVFDAAKTYAPLDEVTYAGSVWIAKAETNAKPDEHTEDGKRAWVLVVKRGREGKPGLKGEPGEKGLKGDKGDTRWS